MSEKINNQPEAEVDAIVVDSEEMLRMRVLQHIIDSGRSMRDESSESN